MKNRVYISFTGDINPGSAEALLNVAIQAANKGAQEIYYLFSSLGGSINSGFTLYNSLRALKIDIVMHNTGHVESVANIVFLAADKRIACPSATFMFHGVAHRFDKDEKADVKRIREILDSIEADEERMAQILAERTAISLDAAKALLVEQKVKNAVFAKTHHIVHAIDEASVPQGVPILQIAFTPPTRIETKPT